MSCLFGSDCCLRSPIDRYNRAMDYIKEAEAKPKTGLQEPLLRRRDTFSFEKPTPTPAQLKLYHKAIPLLQNATWVADADYQLGVLYSRGIVDPETKDRMNGKKGVISRCFAACFERPLPQLPKPSRWTPPMPDHKLLDAAISRFSSAKGRGHRHAGAMLTYLEQKKARELDDWQDEVKRAHAEQDRMRMDEMLRNSIRAIKEVEEIRAQRAERERLVAANPQIPYIERLIEQQRSLQDALNRPYYTRRY